MQSEQTHHYGRFDIFFIISRFTVTPADRNAIRSLDFSQAHGDHIRIHDFITETYDRMFAQERPCHMTVQVSRPLTRHQADMFNLQNASVTAGATAAARQATRFANPWVSGFTVGAVGLAAYFVLETRHAGDVLVAVEARVNGGIGQQSSTRLLLIQAKGGAQ